jgi:hypothetical protein
MVRIGLLKHMSDRTFGRAKERSDIYLEGRGETSLSRAHARLSTTEPQPRALPWADISCPFGAGDKTAGLQNLRLEAEQAVQNPRSFTPSEE